LDRHRRRSANFRLHRLQNVLEKANEAGKNQIQQIKGENMKVALLWNGDKNSALTYAKVKGKFDIAFLLTFLQKEHCNASFLSTLKRQREKLGVPFFWAKMETAYPEEYRESIIELKKDYGIEGIVTNGTQSLVEDACRDTGIKVIRA
jgi:hypothetical protein